MESMSKAERLPLPEQLYLMLTDPRTGEPPTSRRQRTQGLLAAGLAWELIERGVVTVDPAAGEVVRVSGQALGEACLREGAEILRRARMPLPPLEAVRLLSKRLPAMWRVIGEGMVREGLVREEVRTVLLLFHRRALCQTAEAAREERELEGDLRAAVRQIGALDDEGGGAHRRLLARLVLLDNFGLLREIVGGALYDEASDRIVALKERLRDTARLTRAGRQPIGDPDAGWMAGGLGALWFLDATGISDAPIACGDDCRAFGESGPGGGEACADFSDAGGSAGCDSSSDAGGSSCGGGSDG